MNPPSEIKASNRTLVAAVSGLLLFAVGIGAIPGFFAALGSIPLNPIEAEERTLKLILTCVFSVASFGGIYLTWRSFFIVYRLSSGTLWVTRWPLKQKQFSLQNLKAIKDSAEDRKDGELHLHYLELQFINDLSIKIYTQSRSTQKLLLELARQVDQVRFAPAFDMLFQRYRKFLSPVLKTDLVLEQKIHHGIQEGQQQFFANESNIPKKTVRHGALRCLKWSIPLFMLSISLIGKWSWKTNLYATLSNGFRNAESIFELIASTVLFVGVSLLSRLAPFGLSVSVTAIGLASLELLTGKSWLILSDKWDKLRKWQRGLIVLAVAVISYFAFFFLFLAVQH